MMHLQYLLLALSSGVLANASSIRRQTKTTSAYSSPNPIHLQYSGNVTATINGTLSLLPIPLSLAQSMIPSQYGILTAAYQSLLPGFPVDMYPLVLRAGVVHDIAFGAYDPALSDFQEIGFRFPFVDRLGDGYTSFGYQNNILLSASSPTAQQGVAGYGENPVPATFVPLLEAYDYGASSQSIVYMAYDNTSSTPAFTTQFVSVPATGGWDLTSFMVNVTNQVQFGNGTDCLQQRNYFNTTLSTGTNSPVAVAGKVTVRAPYLPTDTSFDCAYALKVDVAILENYHIACETFQGNANN